MSHTHPEVSPVKRLLNLLSLERQDITNIWIYAAVIGLLSLAVPLGVQALIGLVSGGLLLQPVVLLIVGVVALSAFSGLIQLWQIGVMERVQQRIFARTAFDFANRIPNWRIEALADRYFPEVTNRFFDVVNIQKGIGKLVIDFSAALLQFLFGLILLTFYHPYFIIFGLFILMLLVLLFRLTGPRGLRTSLSESKYKYKVAAWLQSLAGALPAQRLNTAPLAVHKTDGLVAGYLQQRQSHFRILWTQYAALFTFKVLVVAIVLTLGSLLVADRQITLGQFVASELVIVMVLASVEKIVLNLDTFYDLLTGLDKVGHVTDQPVVTRGGLPAPHTPEGLALRVEQLRVRDERGLVVKALDLDIRAGERIGIWTDNKAPVQGMMQYLSGIRTEVQGMALLDGIRLEDYSLPGLQSQVASCYSLRALFEGTLMENLMVQQEEDLRGIQPLLDRLVLTDEIAHLSGGLQQHILPGGITLNGALAWRVLLARALYARPRLLLVANAIDAQPMSLRPRVADVLFDQRQPYTLLLETQDVDVLRRCDRVLVLRNGEGTLYPDAAQGITEIDCFCGPAALAAAAAETMQQQHKPQA